MGAKFALSAHAEEDKKPIRTTISIPEIAHRLGICQDTIYEMLKNKEIPNIRHKRKYIVSRVAFERWEQTIGEDSQKAPRVA